METCSSVQLEKLAVPPDILKNTVENELVIDIIFNNVENPPVELISCRSVCRIWNLRATKSLQKWNWKNRNFVTLNGGRNLEKYLETFGPSFLAQTRSNSLVLRRGKQIVKKPESEDIPDEILHQCFNLNLQNTYGCSNPKILILEPFFRFVDQRIKSLKLTLALNLTLTLNLEGSVSGSDNLNFCLENILKTQSNSLEEFSIVVYEKNADDNLKTKAKPSKKSKQQNEGFRLSKLNHLCITLGTEPEKPNRERKNQGPFQARILESLLSKIPEGKSAKICLLKWPMSSETIDVFQQQNQIKNLKVLELTHVGNDGELKSLGEAGVKLEFLRASSSPNLPTQAIYDLLCSQQYNLEMLCWRSGWKFRFPPGGMTALKKLKLECQGSGGPFDFNSGNGAELAWHQNDVALFYSEYFPQLEELDLECVYRVLMSRQAFMAWVLPAQLLPCTTLKKFSINFSKMNAEILKSISDTFPQITSLTISSTFHKTKIEQQIFFKTLWGAEFAPILEEFYIQLDTCITDQEWQDNKKKETEVEWWGKYEVDSLLSGENEERIEQIFVSRDYDAWQSEPGALSILNFKSLKTLTIKEGFDFGLQGGALTDFSAYCLFGRLKNLTYLELELKIRNFSEAAKRNLQNKIRQRPIYCPNESSQDRLEKVFQSNFSSLTGQPLRGENFRDMDLDFERYWNDYFIESKYSSEKEGEKLEELKKKWGDGRDGAEVTDD